MIYWRVYSIVIYKQTNKWNPRYIDIVSLLYCDVAENVGAKKTNIIIRKINMTYHVSIITLVHTNREHWVFIHFFYLVLMKYILKTCKQLKTIIYKKKKKLYCKYSDNCWEILNGIFCIFQQLKQQLVRPIYVQLTVWLNISYFLSKKDWIRYKPNSFMDFSKIQKKIFKNMSISTNA